MELVVAAAGHATLEVVAMGRVADSGRGEAEAEVDSDSGVAKATAGAVNGAMVAAETLAVATTGREAGDLVEVVGVERHQAA